jgi:hypothetical protein
LLFLEGVAAIDVGFLLVINASGGLLWFFTELPNLDIGEVGIWRVFGLFLLLPLLYCWNVDLYLDIVL